MSYPRGMFPGPPSEEEPPMEAPLMRDPLFEMPSSQTYWLLGLLALLIIAVLAALAFAFALAGFLKKDKDCKLPASCSNKETFVLPGVCNGRLCIGIASLPISLVGGNCYALVQNLTLNSGDGIVINGQRNIDLCYNNFNIIINASLPQPPLLIHNSSDIRVYNAYHHSPTQLVPIVGALPFGIRIQLNIATNSTGIYLYSPVMLNFVLGIVASGSDVTVIDPLIIANTAPTSTNAIGISTGAMLNLVVKGGLISMKANSGSSTSTGIAVGNLAASAAIEGISIENCAIGIVASGSKNVRISHVKIVQDPLGFGLTVLQIGGAQPTQNAIIEDVHVDCSAGTPRSDCVDLFNVRSVIVDGLTLIGSTPPVPGTYSGGMLSISGQRIAGSQNFKWSAESIDLRRITIRMLDDTSIGLNIDTGIMLGNTRNTTVTVRDSTIKGGLAAVMISGHAQNVVLEGITVGDAPYGFVVTNGSNTVVMNDCKALSCCLGYWAAPGTSVVGVYNSHAQSCATSYLNQGTDCEMGTGFGSEGNNRILGQTNANCTLPNLPFLPIVSILDDDPDFLLASEIKLGLLFDDNGLPLFM